MLREIVEAKRYEFEGISATQVYKTINTKNKSTRVDYDGLEIETVIDGSDYYIVYKDYGDEVMRIIQNPNKKDMKDFEDALEAS